ncbi:MAG: hypothetical protein Q4B22_12230, partial [Eubacteriales bacterium]|nr:hypothetical protein [Eubacteriales bacterium]
MNRVCRMAGTARREVLAVLAMIVISVCMLSGAASVYADEHPDADAPVVVAEETTVEEPKAEELTAEDPAAEEPAAEEPKTVEEPAAEEP